MKYFPDESKMDRSQDGSDPIRGGSIGFNRVFGYFVNHAQADKIPAFNAVLISAFTIYRNVVATYKDSSIEELESHFVKDISLFLEYYDIYLSHTKSSFSRNKKAPVVIYFPSYDRVNKKLLIDPSKGKMDLLSGYKKLMTRTGMRDSVVKDLENVTCFWTFVGNGDLPHRELSFKFKNILTHSVSMYGVGDDFALITHIPLDFYIGFRIRGVKVLESFTGSLKKFEDVKFKLDTLGRVPFNSTVHGVLGDKVLIKPLVDSKTRKEILSVAEKEKWVIRSEHDIRLRISKIANIPIDELRKFDFV